MCVCAEKLPPFFNKQDEKHKVKTPWNWTDPNKTYTNGALMYYSIYIQSLHISKSVRLRHQCMVNIRYHLAKKLPRTESCTPATIWSWIKPLNGVPSFGTKYWFLTFTAKKNIQLRISSFIIWLVYVIICAKLTYGFGHRNVLQQFHIFLEVPLISPMPVNFNVR